MRSELNQNRVRRYSEIQFHFEHTSVSECYYPSLLTSVRISLSTTELERTNLPTVVARSWSRANRCFLFPGGGLGVARVTLGIAYCRSRRGCP